jgi:MFS family permease
MSEATGEALLARPTAPPAPVEATALEPLDMKKAINYSVANIGSSIFYGLFNFGMSLYLNSYGLQAWLIGLLANERSFVGAFVQPVVGRISDRTRSPLGRRRPFFLIGVPLVCAGLFMLAFHPPFWVMLAVMTVLAFFLSVAWDPYMAMMADLFPERHRGRVGGMLGMGVGLGNIAFALIAMYFWEKHEFSVFMFIIGMLIVTWAWTFMTVKEPPIGEHVEVSQKSTMSIWEKIRGYVDSVARYPEAAKYVLAITFFWLGTGGVIPFITLFGIKVLGVSEGEAFILPLAATVANALLAVPAGILADRTSKKLVMIIGMVGYGAVAIVGSQSQVLWQAVIALTLAGIANSAMAQVTPLLTDLVPKKRMAEFVGLGSSVFSFAQPLGSFLAGIVVVVAGWLVGGDQAYRWAFIFAGVMLVTGALLLMRVHPESFVDREEDVEPAALPTMAY